MHVKTLKNHYFMYRWIRKNTQWLTFYNAIKDINTFNKYRFNKDNRYIKGI